MRFDATERRLQEFERTPEDLAKNQQVAATDGRWFLVRIMPYRTMEDVIDGVVITFTNITAAKALEAELREENARLKGLLEAGG